MATIDEPLITISDPDQDRYARLRLMEGYRQDVIEQAQIMVVGAGALGNEVLKNLALLGAGHLLVVDFDTIEVSNLTRSVLFRQEDKGRAKAEIVAERVRNLNPDVKIVPVKGDITAEIGLGVFRQMDLVLGCLDNRSARMALNRACWRVGRPWIDGALNVADGSVRVFVPHEGACYECLMTKQDYALANIRYACPPGTIMEGVAITTPMSASIIGAMQVQEGVKLLHGLSMQGSQGVYYSAESLRLTHVAYPRRADCPAHERYAPITSLPYGVQELTIGLLLELAQKQMGEKAFLALPDKIVTYFFCPHCDLMEKVYRPYRLVVPGQVLCEKCGTARVYDVTSTVTRSDATRDLPLAQLGIPAFDILDVRAGQQRAFFELAGDQERVLAGWNRRQ